MITKTHDAMKEFRDYTIDAHKYDEAKEEIKKKIDNGDYTNVTIDGLKIGELTYPTSMNSLTQTFLTVFSYYLDYNDFVWFVGARKASRSDTSTTSSETKNWYPAFRSLIGSKLFLEFTNSNKNSTKSDTHGDCLDIQLAARMARMEGGVHNGN